MSVLSNLISIIILMFLMLLLPLIIIVIIIAAKRNNARKFKKKFGYSPEVFEQLKRHKQLLDTGVITKDEFEKIKSQLLNL